MDDDRLVSEVRGLMTVIHYDLRGEPGRMRPGRQKIYRGSAVLREPATVTGITIHQTACLLPGTRADRADHGDEGGSARRYLAIPCHALSGDGWFATGHDLRTYLYHANGLNRCDLGLEVEGLYPGVVGGRTWRNFPATEWIQGRIDAAREALTWLVAEGRALGMPIRYVHAHRQSSPTRASDPGEAIWRSVVEEYAVPILGLEPEYERTWGEGQKVDPRWR